MWGFSVEAELVENSEKQDELCCYVSRVEERSVAMNSGKTLFATSCFFIVSFNDVVVVVVAAIVVVVVGFQILKESL